MYSWDVFGLSGQFVDKSGTSGLTVYQHYREWFESIYGKNATASEWQAGGGSASPGGVGRHPAGYESDEGVPSISLDGYLVMLATPYGLSDSPYVGGFFSDSSKFSGYGLLKGESGSGTRTPLSRGLYFCYSFTAPVDGIYFLSPANNSYPFGTYQVFYSNSWNSTFSNRSFNPYISQIDSRVYSTTISKGQNYFFANGMWGISDKAFTSYGAYKYSINPIPIFIEPLDSSNVTNQTNITINNNAWTGSIYVDSSTNLTYIYPQYTTINENNETVTNISNNPIIYNSETNEYYTYDSVTNNYYYITYEPQVTPTPDPSPSPSPSPDPDNPDTPTPTPTPGGGSSGGNGSSGGGSTFNPFQWLADLLKDVIEGIFKLLWNLVGTLFGFVLWLLSLLGKLFPFLPDGCALALSAGVIIVLILKIIKFILGR